MSAFEPQTTEPKVDMPDFMVVLRGFDRRQVETWAAEIAGQLEQERLRADEAEKRAYRVQIEDKGAPSFTHLGTHVASILEEAGRSSENMLADAAERAQETVDAAEEEAAQIIKAAEHRAGEIEGEAQQTLELARSEGARVEEDALQAAEEMRAQAEQDARAVLEEARDATDLIWQEAERERLGVEAETIRLETLRHRSLEQLGRVYGHLESVLDEVRAGIGRVEEEQEDLEEATAAAAARLGVEPPASSPEESPRFPSPRDVEERQRGDDGAGDGMLSATRPDTAMPDLSLSASRPGGDLPEQAAPSGEAGAPSSGGDATQPDLGASSAETTRPTSPGDTTATVPPVPDGTADSGEAAPAGEDATQRLDPVAGNDSGGNRASPSKPAAREGKGRH